MTSSLENAIIGIVRCNMTDPLAITIDSNTQVIDELGLDSMALTHVLSELEERFGFEIAIEDINIANFKSISRIEAFVLRKLERLESER